MKLNLVLLQPEIPHNTGAIGRLCVGLDAILHLVKPLGFSLDDAYVKRCGLDYWQHLNLKIHETWEEFKKSEQPEDICFVSTKGNSTIYDYNFTTDTYLVFGNETRGLPSEFYNEYDEHLYSIPMPGSHARSINLANAASIAAYEAFRQIKVRNT